MTKKLIIGFSVIIILLQTLFISYISYVDFIDLQIITSNSLMSENAIIVLFKEGSKAPSLKGLIDSYPKVNILAELHNDTELQVWGIIGDSFLNKRTEALIKGRFFNKNDFFKQKPKAVIGKNIIDFDNYLVDKSGKEAFLFSGDYYQIIGYISSDISNMLDNTVFVNLDSLNINLSKFIIDGLNSYEITNVVNNLKKEGYDISIIERQDNFIERYIFNEIDQSIFNVLIIFFISVFLGMLLIFTLYYYKEEIRIKRIVGVGFDKILFAIFGEIIFLTVVNTTFMGIAYAIIYYVFLRDIYINIYFHSLIIFSFVTLLILCFLIYLYMIISNNIFCKNGVK